MVIHRRTLLKQLLFISASVTIIPSCLYHEKKTGLVLKHFKVSTDQEATFSALFDTILPDTDTPGALKVKADLFAWKILDDCSSTSDQEIILKGLNELNTFSLANYNIFFYKLTRLQREKLIKEIEDKKDKSNLLLNFYQKAKGLAIYGFLNSEYFMTNVELYEQIPGRFFGCVNI